MEHVSQEKYIILVSFQNWHWQNSLNPRHILFLHKNWSGWYFEQSILSCLNPTFRDKNFFPRRALGVLWAPPGSPLGIFPKSTPSDSLQMQHVSQEKYIILVSFQNWHSQNSLNPRHILFSQKNWSGWYFRAPPCGPLGIFLTSTPSDALQMEHVSQEMYIILVSSQNWYWQNNLNPRHILFLHKNWSGWKNF